MHITVEDKETLVYVYVRKFNGKIVSTYSSVKCKILYDEFDNWIGLEILNEFCYGKEFNLPPIKNVVINFECEKIIEDSNKLLLLFDCSKTVDHYIKDSCNVDFNDEGFFGVELILDKSIGGLGNYKRIIKEVVILETSYNKMSMYTETYSD